MKILLTVLLLLSLKAGCGNDSSAFFLDGYSHGLLVKPPNLMKGDLNLLQYDEVEGKGLRQVLDQIRSVAAQFDRKYTTQRIEATTTGRFIDSNQLRLRIFLFSESCHLRLDLYSDVLILDDLYVFKINSPNSYQSIYDLLNFKEISRRKFSDKLVEQFEKTIVKR